MSTMDILEDLYQLDPTLREREDELMDILKKLAASKPEAEPDEAFRERLKKELLEKIDRKEKPKPKILLFSRANLLRAAGLCAAALALMVGLRVFMPGRPASPFETDSVAIPRTMTETAERSLKPRESPDSRTETPSSQEKIAEAPSAPAPAEDSPAPTASPVTPAAATEPAAEAPAPGRRLSPNRRSGSGWRKNPMRAWL